MSSFSSILSIASGAMGAQQRAIGTTANNISNALTDGYSRQRVELAPGLPLMTPQGAEGTGVRVMDVTRSRDVMLDSNYRTASGDAAASQARSQLLGRVESALREPGSDGLSAALDKFWSSWSDLADNPSSQTARSAVRESGQELADQFHRVNGLFIDMATNARAQVSANVDQLNQLSTQVAALNKRIVAAESGGHSAPNLRDARDLALDKMAAIAPIQVVQRSAGDVGVSVGGISLVDGGDAETMKLQSSGGTLHMTSAAGTPVTLRSGALGGLLDVLNNVGPAYQSRLNTLAGAVVSSVNALHEQGVTQDASGNPRTGVDFLATPTAGAEAATIGLSATVSADVSAVAAGRGAADGSYQPDANGLALDLGGLRSGTVSSLGAQSAGGYYNQFVGDFGLAVADAKDSATSQSTVRNQADTQRKSVSGVSTDEEMVQLIQHQNAYAAAARIVTAVDNMMQSLIQIG